MSSLPELSVPTRSASRPADSPLPTVEHSAAGEWCRGRSTKTPTSRLCWGSRSADSTLSSLAALYVQYRTLRDDTLWFCGVIGNATKFHFRQRYQTEQVMGGRPRLPCIILCMKVDARCSLTTVCPAQKQTKPLTFLCTSMSSTQSTDRKSSTGMGPKSFWLKSEIFVWIRRPSTSYTFSLWLNYLNSFKFLELKKTKQICCIKVWLLGLWFPKWFEHRGKSRPVTTHEI